MEDLKFLIYFCVCVGSIGCQKTTDTCRRFPRVTLTARSTEQFITSPGFPDNYANDLNCYWIVRNTAASGLIRIDVKLLDLERGYDKLRLIYGSSSITEKNVVTTSEHVIPSENVTITFTSDGDNRHSGFKLSYSITETEHQSDNTVQCDNTVQSDNTVLIALASTIGIVCIVTIIVHIVVHLYCRKRSSQTTPSDTVIFHNERKEKTKRPYVDMGIRDHSEIENQREASSTGDIYEDVGNAEDLGNNKQDYYIMDKPGAENEQGDTVKLHNERKEKTKLPYVNMGIPGHCENGNQREASSTDEFYEDVGNAEDLGTDNEDEYIIPGAKKEQGTEMYINTGTTNDFPEPIVCIRHDGDEDVYEEFDDNINGV